MPISTTYTRAQLRDLVADERRVTFSGTAEKARVNRDIQIAVSRVWEILTRTDQGIGLATREVTIAEGALLDQVPGPSVPLPDDFRRVVALRVNGCEARRVPPAEMLAMRDALAAYGRGRHVQRPYYVSGPGQITDAQLITTAVAARLEVYPDWAVGDQYTLLYVVQPPALLDDAAEIDLLMEPVVRYIVAMAAFRGTARDDQTERARLSGVMTEAAAEFDPARAVRAGGTRRLSDYRPRY